MSIFNNASSKSKRQGKKKIWQNKKSNSKANWSITSIKCLIMRLNLPLISDMTWNKKSKRRKNFEESSRIIMNRPTRNFKSSKSSISRSLKKIIEFLMADSDNICLFLFYLFKHNKIWKNSYYWWFYLVLFHNFLKTKH